MFTFYTVSSSGKHKCALVTSDIRGALFESSHRQKFVNCHDENKEKEVGNDPFKNISASILSYDGARGGFSKANGASRTS